MTLTLIAVPFVLFGGFMIAGICGYMAGLIGASNSPISGVGILSIVIFASVLILAVPPAAATQSAMVVRVVHDRDRVRMCHHLERQPPGPEDRPASAHHRCDSRSLSSWRGGGCGRDSVRAQPAGEGVRVRGAANIGVVAPNPLPAPQATLIAALAQGVIGRNLEWTMIGIARSWAWD